MLSFVFPFAWLIPVGPLLAFVLISWGGFGRPLPSRQLPSRPLLSRATALVGLVVALLLTQAVFWGTIAAPGIYASASVAWFGLGTETMRVGAYIDPTAAVMGVLVTLVCLILCIHGDGSPRAEPLAGRFFASLSLCAGAMLGVIVADNLLLLLIFGSMLGVGFTLMTGFRWETAAARRQALRTMIMSGIGDSFLLLGVALLYAHVGTLAYGEVFSAATVARLATTPCLGSLSVATVAILLLLGGAIGKSVAIGALLPIAQLPLPVRLSDAEQGPTPVSALIHTATMGSLGLYLMLRAFPLLAASQAMSLVALVGSGTAVYAAVAALMQRDLRRTLAYSTLGQFGFVLVGLGAGAYAASLFLVIAHVVGKLLLFVTFGSVMRGLEYGQRYIPGHALPLAVTQEPLDANDMFKMGGLAFRMPLTALTFLAGSLALCAFPLLPAAFWFSGGSSRVGSGHGLAFLLLALAAGLTAFYAARQMSLIFLTVPRSRAAIYARDRRPAMVLPMVIWAVLALGWGSLGIPRGLPLLGRLLPARFASFVETSLGQGLADSTGMPAILVGIVSVAGFAGGWWVYGRKAIPMQGDALLDPLHGVVMRVTAKPVELSRRIDTHTIRALVRRVRGRDLSDDIRTTLIFFLLLAALLIWFQRF
jgi:NADH-quinone oxidoreductase subunit L